MDYLRKDKWSPYLVGTIMGILGWFIFYIGEAFGTTTAFQKVTGMIIGIFSKDHILNSEYYMKYFKTGIISWQVIFVIFLFFGSLYAAKLTKIRKIEYVPQIWKQNYGPSKIKRNIFAFIGGVILMFGARFAGGCTSGHAISGGLQLSLVSWIFMLTVFAFGIPAALIIYRKSLRGKNV